MNTQAEHVLSSPRSPKSSHPMPPSPYIPTPKYISLDSESHVGNAISLSKSPHHVSQQSRELPSTSPAPVSGSYEAPSLMSSGKSKRKPSGRKREGTRPPVEEKTAEFMHEFLQLQEQILTEQNISGLDDPLLQDLLFPEENEQEKQKK
jgi:hypothetical protein